MDVLLVDDEPLLREQLQEDLAEAGLDVMEAENAEAALQLADSAAAAPAVLVTDVNLGGAMDGLMLAAEGKRRWPRMGVVVITGQPENLRQRLFGPRERFLIKPFTPARLVLLVQDLMQD